MFKSKLGEMEIVYNSNERMMLYQEVNSNKKWFKPQTLLFRDKEDNVVSNKEKAMQSHLNFMRNTVNCKMELMRTVENVHTNCRTIS